MANKKTKILRFPITIIRDSPMYNDWKLYSSASDVTMENYLIKALEEKIERDKKKISKKLMKE
ncbi:MAG: hypothetical protein U9O94_04175 [Nanoarchaeota archaeon]|nr:hypothetical protein [Nanoarchaeota archaeon]